MLQGLILAAAILLAGAALTSPLGIVVCLALATAWVAWRVLRMTLRRSWAALRPVPKAPLSPTAQRLLDWVYPRK